MLSLLRWCLRYNTAPAYILEKQLYTPFDRVKIQLQRILAELPPARVFFLQYAITILHLLQSTSYVDR